MKKLYKRMGMICLLSFSIIFMVGCGNKVTPEVLMKNDWLIPSSVEDEPDMLSSFSKTKITMKIDPDSMKSEATNEWEEMGEEFAKSLIDMIEIKFDYTLKGKKMTWIDDETDNTSIFSVSREKENIILTPDKSSDDFDNLEVLVLEPLDTKKKKTTSKTKESPEETMESSSESFEATLKDDTLSADDFTLVYKESSIINSPMENKPGLYVSFELTNNSEEPIVPADILNAYVVFEQTTETSIVSLADNYYDLDAFGADGDWDTYNRQVDRGNSLQDRLLPGKTITIYNAYALKDTTSPIKLIPQLNYEDLSSFEIQPKKIPVIKIAETAPEAESQSETEIPVDDYETDMIDDAETHINNESTPPPAVEEVAPEPENTAGEYIEVKLNEGPKDIAARAGISVDQLYKLNGMTADNFFLTPGQQLRIK